MSEKELPDRKLDAKTRIALIRKGNEVFKNGDIQTARRIFITTAYIDGLIRLGDYYYFEKKDLFNALAMYMKAKYRKRLDELGERMAAILKKWMNEEKE